MKNGIVFFLALTAVLITSIPAKGLSPIRTLTGHSFWVTSVTFSPDGSLLASAGGGEARLWRVPSGSLVRTLKGHADYVTSVAFSPDGKYVASGSWDKTVRLQRVSSHVFQVLRGHSNYVTCVAFSPDGRFIASGSMDKTIKIWRMDGGLVSSLQGHSDAINSLAFGRDGNSLASGGEDKKIIIWHLPDGKMVKKFKGHSKPVTSLIFDANGTHLISGGKDKAIKIWSVSDWKCVQTIKEHTGAVRSLHLSSDGKFLASASSDGTIKLWNTSEYRLISTLSAHRGDVTSVAFSPGGRYLASGGYDMTAKLWDLEMIPEIKEQRTLPCDLIAEVKFQDQGARVPNNLLDAAEEATLLIGVKNEGQGAGYGVALNLSSDNAHVTLTSSETIGEIPPGASKTVRIPIQADLNTPDGTATITIETKEKRGYDARPIKLRIPVGHLDKPVLEFASAPQLNDGSGLAEGNSNGIPENNERIELVAFVRNSGVGEAQDVTVKLASINPGLTPTRTEDRLATILPGQTERARLAFAIPRLFSETTIRYRLEAKDELGASRTVRTFEIPFQQNVPILAYESRILDEYGNPAETLTNDAGFEWEITPSNVGQNAAQGVRLSVSTDQRDITFDRSRAEIGTLAPNRPGAVQRFPFRVPRTFSGTEVTLQMGLTQSDFPSKSDEVMLPVQLRRPRLVETHDMIDADRNGVIEQGDRVTFFVDVRNDGNLEARDVKIEVNVPKRWVEFRDERLIGTLLPGESQSVSFDLTIRPRTEVGDLPVYLTVRQSDGFEGIEKTLTYPVKDMQEQVVTVEGERRERRPTRVATPAFNIGPLVTIAYPVDGETVPQETVRFEGTATAQGVGKRIGSTVITVNGERQSVKDKRGLKAKSRGITIESVGEGQVRFSGYIRLKEGVNTIQVRAYDNENLSAEQTITVTRQGKMPTLWAVVIGVSRYQDQRLNLRYADRDAQAFYEFLRSPMGGGLDDKHIVLLTNEQATNARIFDALTNFLRQAREEDAVIIFLASHGVIDDYGDLYFLGHDSDRNNPMGTAVANDQLMKVVGQVIKARKKVLYIDACHAGEFGMSPTLAMRGDQRATQTNKLVLKIAEADPSLVIFSASGGSEFSREDARWGGGHGVFTYYLLKGLRGEANVNGDDIVTVSELDDYLRREVGRATDNKQRPEVKGWRDSEFPLSVIK